MAFDLKVVAEGVKTQEQENKLINMNCDYVQGYFYSRPLDGENLEKFTLSLR